MGQLIYSALTSLDGYVADEAGNFDWAVPDPEVHHFVNDQERRLGICLYGRRLYDVMKAWETEPTAGDGDPVMQEYARIWQDCEKVVYSRTLDQVSSARTRIERSFDPAAVRELKSKTVSDLGIGGPELAGQALLAGLVDECRVLVSPAIVGGGQRWLPDGLRADLVLADERRFDNGVVHLSYRVRV
jgi:dihydrofolate reductase